MVDPNEEKFLLKALFENPKDFTRIYVYRDFLLDNGSVLGDKLSSFLEDGELCYKEILTKEVRYDYDKKFCFILGFADQLLEEFVNEQHRKFSVLRYMIEWNQFFSIEKEGSVDPGEITVDPLRNVFFFVLGDKKRKIWTKNSP